MHVLRIRELYVLGYAPYWEYQLVWTSGKAKTLIAVYVYKNMTSRPG